MVSPMRLDIDNILEARSQRVKCVDIHPTEPWVLACQYDGTVQVYNYEKGTVIKSWDVSDKQPIRCGVFVPRKQWVIVGADDMMIRVYNYNTMEKVKVFEAHYDYIRGLAVHPSLPLLISCSDDMIIRLWDWEKGWSNTMAFEGHSHYVMAVRFNPKDPNTFASASLDHTVKVWNLSSPVPNFTLEGQDSAGVNCLDYYTGGDKPYLVTGGDDRLVRIWDYQTKTCVQSLEGHSHNVSSVAFLPDRPLIVSGSEDGKVMMWHSNTYRYETTLNYSYDRCWSIGYLKNSNKVAFGFDEGIVLIRMGKDEPVASMDSSGKIIYARHNEVSTVNLRNADLSSLSDGERVPVPSKDLGSCEVYPNKLSHSPNGRFVAVCGDGEYIIYTALAWRNKSFGSADEVVWDNGSGEYATHAFGSSTVTIYSRSFKERTAMKTNFVANGIFGGALLGVKGLDFVCFYDWSDLQLIRRIDVTASSIYWSGSADKVILVSDTSFYVLKYSQDAVDRELSSRGGQLDQDGVEDAFELLHEIPEAVVTGQWVRECFVYTNRAGRLNYVVGTNVTTLHHLDRPMFVVGYLPKGNRVLVIDKEYNIMSYQLLVAVLDFKTAIVRGDLEAAEKAMARVPRSEYNKLARFLESQGLKEKALEVATDADYRCELAISLGKLDTAAQIARAHPSEHKWRQLTDLAVSHGDFDLAEECMRESNDFSGLLMLHSARASQAGIMKLSDDAASAGKNNIAFLCAFISGDVDKCVSILVSSGRLPEAAVFARTYAPSRVADIVDMWRVELRKSSKNVRVADALADPKSHPHFFEAFEDSLAAEEQAEMLRKVYGQKSSLSYAEHENDLELELSELLAKVSMLSNGNGYTAGTQISQSSTEMLDRGDTKEVGDNYAEDNIASAVAQGDGATNYSGQLLPERVPSLALETQEREAVDYPDISALEKVQKQNVD